MPSPPPREPAPQRQPAKPQREGRHHCEARDGKPPRQAERANEGEGDKRRQRRLDQDDRHLGDGQRAELGRSLGSDPAQGGNANGESQLTVDDVAEVADAGDPVELVSADGPPGGAHAAVPRLAAGDQRGQLQQRRTGDRRHRDGRKRVRQRRPFPTQREGEKPEASERPNHKQARATPEAGLGYDGASALLGAPWARTRRRSPTF
jgi:hypothetical protein